MHYYLVHHDSMFCSLGGTRHRGSSLAADCIHLWCVSGCSEHESKQLSGVGQQVPCLVSATRCSAKPYGSAKHKHYAGGLSCQGLP